MNLTEHLILPSTIATERTAIVGVSGSGKTNTAVVMAESLLRSGVPVVVIDPLDVWHGIKSSRDGLSEGFPVVVFGGDSQDLPLTLKGADSVAEAVVRLGVPAILSLREFMMNEQTEIVHKFLSRLFQLKGRPENRTAMTVFIDEASMFAPQSGDQTALRDVANIVRRGRTSGIGTVLIDQRPASVSKEVLSQVSTLICHKLTSPQDRKAVESWTSRSDHPEQNAFLSTLSSLRTGEAWVYQTGGHESLDRVTVPIASTFDSRITPAPGEAAVMPKKLALSDLESLKESLSTIVSEHEQNDPAVLHDRIRELESQLSTELPQVDDKEIERLRILVAQKEATISRLILELDQTETVLSELGDISRRIKELVEDHLAIRTAMKKQETAPIQSKTFEEQGLGELIKPRPEDTRKNFKGETPEGLSDPQRQIIYCLGNLKIMGIREPKREIVASLIQRSHLSSGYANNLGALRSKGLIDYPSKGRVCLTPDGEALCDPSNYPVYTLSDLHNGFFRMVSNAQADILSAVIKSHPSPVTKSWIANEIGKSATSSGFANNLGNLRNTWGLIDYPSSGMVCATDLLFPERLK